MCLPECGRVHTCLPTPYISSSPQVTHFWARDPPLLLKSLPLSSQSLSSVLSLVCSAPISSFSHPSLALPRHCCPGSFCKLSSITQTNSVGLTHHTGQTALFLSNKSFCLCHPYSHFYGLTHKPTQAPLS